MDRVCLVRNVAHTESGDHVAAHHYMMTGYSQRPDPTGQPIGSTIYPAYGSVLGRQLGWQDGLTREAGATTSALQEDQPDGRCASTAQQVLARSVG